MDPILFFDPRSQIEINKWMEEIAHTIFPAIYPDEPESPEKIQEIVKHMLKNAMAKHQQKIEAIKSAKAERKKTFQEKIEDNLNFANGQQQKERARDFKLELEGIPSVILDYFQITNDKLNEKLVSVTACQGNRPYMEDAYLAVPIEFRVGDQMHQAQLVGVFDGHGDVDDKNLFQDGVSPGAQAAQFVRNHLTRELIKALESHNSQILTDEGIGKALSASLKTIDKIYEGYGGTTATVALILEKKVWIANVGDSRAIFLDKTQTRQVSADASLLDERYQNKVYKLGGLVFPARDAFRINGFLAMGTAIGDHEIRGITGLRCIPTNPEITYVSFDETEGKDNYLILMSDGLTGVASTNEIGDFMYELIAQGYSLTDISKYLVYGALVNRSDDNITVAIVKLSDGI